MIQQINPELLREWKKGGELIAIWRCNKCFKKIPLYKTNSELVNSIYLSFARFEKYCPICKLKISAGSIPQKKVRREIILLRKYEGIVGEEENNSF